MKVININLCTGDLHFPIVQAQPIKIENQFFKRTIDFLTYRRKWKVKEDYCLWVPSLAAWIFIPEYFVFDGASVPKILNNIYSPTGMLFLGAAPHDFGYKYEGLLHVDHKGFLTFVSCTKKELDDIFCHICSYESGMKSASKIATFALKVFGFLSWKAHRKTNHTLIKDFPELFVPEDENESV